MITNKRHSVAKLQNDAYSKFVRLRGKIKCAAPQS